MFKVVPEFVLWTLLVTLWACALGIRWHNIERPNHVVWDETHFGKYTGYYINRTFFFDVHPPLGKLLLAVAGYYTGYQADFPFEEPGDKYEGPEYIAMREFPAIAGSLVVPVSAATVWELTRSLKATMLSGLLLLSDTALTTISRYILFDPFFLLLMSLAGYCYVRARAASSLSSDAWFWFALTGTAIGCLMATKFVAIFTILSIGFSVIIRLCNIWRNTNIKTATAIQEFMMRVYTLICLPVVVYMAVYVFHFIVLRKSGPGDGFYSSPFQSTLIGNPLFHARMPEYVCYGSNISLRQTTINGNYLHSHASQYPQKISSTLQQVTGYHHRDQNNYWKILSNTKDNFTKTKMPPLIKDNDMVILQHQRTLKYLSVQDAASSLTQNHYLVGCDSLKEASEFRLKIITNTNKKGLLIPVFAGFSLTNEEFNCTLESRHKSLPKWASEQSEITCNPNLKISSSAAYHLWNVEHYDDHRLDVVRIDFKGHTPGFWSKFIESHLVMFHNNKNLKPKHTGTSRPWMWPIAWDKQLFSQDPDIVLRGNVICHWLILSVGGISFLCWLCKAVIRQRAKAYGKESKPFDLHWSAMAWLFQMWVFNYLPYWTMTRVLYNHHYIPSFIWSAMFAAVAIDKFLNNLNETFLMKVLFVVLLLAFILVGPLSFYMQQHYVFGSEQSVMSEFSFLPLVVQQYLD